MVQISTRRSFGLKQVRPRQTSLPKRLCNFAKKLPEKEGNSDPKLVSCKYWDTTVEMLMVGISVILSATNQKIDAWKTEGIIFSFPVST